MSHSKKIINLRLLEKAFKQLCEENRTELFQIIRKKVEVLSFDIKAGKIVSLKYRIKNNEEVLPDIGMLDVDIDVPINENNLQDLLDSLDQSNDFPSALIETNDKINSQQLSDELSENLKKALTERIGPISNIIFKEVFERIKDINTVNNNDTQRLSSETKEILKESLAQEIGPISKIVCKQIFEKVTGKDVVINMLANKIPDASRAQNFGSPKEVRIF